jgi:hypothetical protein
MQYPTIYSSRLRETEKLSEMQLNIYIYINKSKYLASHNRYDCLTFDIVGQPVYVYYVRLHVSFQRYHCMIM